ncbi:hypothetical protein [Bdellovibrio reynosensis]|uniref:Uncharacterized protein n=1 Tax=Bdellovibrio reynosensis TaxID=2835041 RepID=A0ABY4CD50_9BACT|nr:hypothetical protein [Bdellovibrio reynosensis]UOF01787.1 hypothetical protein MNR06_02320 [Bdellovibrio reynosensis]
MAQQSASSQSSSSFSPSSNASRSSQASSSSGFGSQSSQSSGKNIASTVSDFSSKAMNMVSNPETWSRVLTTSSSYLRRHPVAASFAGIAGVGLLRMFLKRRH